MSTALLEPPVITTTSIPDEAPTLGSSLAAWAAKDFTNLVASDIKFTFDTSPITLESSQPLFVNSIDTGWSSATLEWAATDFPFKPGWGGFYYGRPTGYTTRTAVELGRLLRDAAARIEVFGWVQETMRDELGRLCAFGALRMAGASDWDLEAINQAACKRLGERGERDLMGLPYKSIPRWNDAKGRTAGEVTALMRAVADDYDAQAGAGDRHCPCGAPQCMYSERVPVGV